MDDLNKTELTSASLEPQDISEEIENVEEEEVDTQPASEADVKEDTSNEQVDSPVSNWENEKKSMSGKISQLERERNEFAQAQKILQALNSAAEVDPEFMRLANKKLVEQGLLDESALQEIGEPQPSKPRVDGYSEDPALQWAKKKMQEEVSKREEFFVNFEKDRPDLLDDRPEVLRANRSAVGAAAARLIANGSSMEEAYDRAYKQIFHPEKLIEEGKLEGLAQAQGAIPAEGVASGGVASSRGAVELTPQEREMARLFGISEEVYAKTKEE
jgi:hypothetical protein